jgi:hypothetical protein
MTNSQRSPMYSALRVLGGLLIAALVLWVGSALVTRSFWRATPQVLSVGSGFEGSLKLPQEEIDAGLNDGRSAVARKNKTANWFATAAMVSSWVAFFLTSLITLVAGYQGVVSADPSGVDVPDLLKNRSAKFARRVGLLAAGAAVCTALNGRAAADAERSYKAADDLQRRVTQARKSILDAPTADEAQAVLDQLRQETAR